MLMDEEDGEAMRSPESVQRMIEPWLPGEAITIERSAIYNFHGLLAREWRRDRVLIAGDAAHQMPPFLGQGMCSGLRDAANLAWKLDLVLREVAPIALLDSYGEERGQHVRKIIEAAIAFGQIICTVDPDVAAKRDREMLADATVAAQRMAFSLPALTGDLVLEGGGELFVQPLGSGRRLDDVIGHQFAIIGADERALADLTDLWVHRLDAFVTTVSQLGPEAQGLSQWLLRRSATAVIVRPDRYVLWAGRDLRHASKRAARLVHDGKRRPIRSSVETMPTARQGV
jgi:FAD binding domain